MDFGGEITLSAQNLPPGFVLSDGVIPAGQDQARLTLTAPADVQPGTIAAPIIAGTAVFGNAPLVRLATGAESVMQAFSLTHIVPTKEFVVAVLQSPSLALSLGIPPGDSSPPGEQRSGGRESAARRDQGPRQSGGRGAAGWRYDQAGDHCGGQGRSHDHVERLQASPAGTSADGHHQRNPEDGERDGDPRGAGHTDQDYRPLMAHLSGVTLLG